MNSILSRCVILSLMFCLVPFFASCGGGDSGDDDDHAPADDDSADDDDDDDDQATAVAGLAGNDNDDDDDNDDNDNDDDNDDDDNDDDDNDDDSACDEPQLRFSDGFDTYPSFDPPPAPWYIGGMVFPFFSHGRPKALFLTIYSFSEFRYAPKTRYLWYASGWVDLPADLCEVFWIEVWARSFSGGDYYDICIADEDAIYDPAQNCSSSGSPLWSRHQLLVDTRTNLLTTYVDGVQEKQYNFGFTPAKLLLHNTGGSDGIHFTPGSLFDDVAIYDDGWQP